MQYSLPKKRTYADINVYIPGDFEQILENRVKNLDELILQGVFSEEEVEVFKRHGDVISE